MPETVALGPQGRIVIPAKLRRQLGLHRGSRMLLRIDGGRLILQPKESLANDLKKTFRDAPRDAVARLLDERRREPS